MVDLALTRGVPDSYASAEVNHPPVVPFDLPLARIQHRAYVAALNRIGLEVLELPADDRFPDCCFVEDCAVVANGIALITNPGALSRRGEEVAVRESLSGFLKVKTMTSPATLDGGDCMRVGTKIFIGKSARTNQEGIERARAVFSAVGLEIVPVQLADILHLKCVCSPLGPNKILLAEGTIPPDIFGAIGIVEIPNDETYAANCVEINGKVLISSGFPETRRRIEAEGLEVIELDTSEIRKADASLTCMSILF